MPRILVTGGSGFIGTNSIQLLTERGSDVVNFDVTPPLWEAQAGQWVPGDIHDRPRLDSVLEAYAPEAVVHLAAETRVGPRFSLDHYSANTVGTQDLLQALQLHDGVERVIITSTQYVCRPGYVPARRGLRPTHGIWLLYGTERKHGPPLAARRRLVHRPAHTHLGALGLEVSEGLLLVPTARPLPASPNRLGRQIDGFRRQCDTAVRRPALSTDKSSDGARYST